MTFSEKLIWLRRREGVSQEQLADRLGVTRQSVSKWESGTAMPELGKLIALSDLFHVSVDYLVRDRREDPAEAAAPAGLDPEAAVRLERKVDALVRRDPVYRYTSKARFLGLPLLSVRFSHDRCPCRDNTAVGILAVGTFAVGGLPIGVISFGLLPIGMIALGGVSLGMVSVGLLAFGVAAMGYLAIGEAALGVYAAGAAAQGSRIAVGTAANAAAAVGFDAAGGRVLLTGAATTASQVLEFLRAELADAPPPVRGLLSLLIRRGL